MAEADEPGWPLLAQGRDAAIYDLGDGRVLRRALDGRSLAAEAAVMSYAHAGGVPVPAVYDVTDDGAIVMDRVSGRTLLERVLVDSDGPGEAARILLELHDAVHRLAAPSDLRRTSLPGDRLIHLDLHVLNVMCTEAGPVLFDWANARAGPAAADLAMTWLTLVAVDVDEVLGDDFLATATGGRGAGFAELDQDVLRKRWRELLEALAAGMHAEAVAAVLPEVATWRIADRNVAAAEAERVRAACAAFPDLP